MICKSIFMIRMRPVEGKETSLCQVKESVVIHIVLSLYNPVDAHVP